MNVIKEEVAEAFDNDDENQEQTKINELKGQMNAYNLLYNNDSSTPPDDIYRVFARAVLYEIEKSNIDKYEANIDKAGISLIIQVAQQLYSAITLRRTTTITLGKYVLHC